MPAIVVSVAGLLEVLIVAVQLDHHSRDMTN
jgi:hypothetical protein